MQRTEHELRVVSEHPPIVVIDGFATDAELDDALAWFDDPVRIRSRSDRTKLDDTGTSFEFRVDHDPVLGPLQHRMSMVLGIPTSIEPSLRFRSYATGHSHPPHGDHFVIGDAALVSTSMLCLTTPDAGGATRFEYARPTGVRISPRRGRLISWFNVDAECADDPRTTHESLVVDRGTKATVTTFIYRSRECPVLCDARSRWP